MESPIVAILRDVLCASLSLDDGLTALQGLAQTHPEEIDLAYDIARVIEEIILRRPGLASAKLLELIVRLSFSENRTLPKMLMLLDTRYTNSYRRTEAELTPDIQALPVLLDLLGELSQAMTLALELNLRPLLPFLADETLLTLDAIYERAHEATNKLAIHEVHYLTTLLIENGMFDCAEALLNRLLELAHEMGLADLEFDIALNEATVLTELGLYEDCRKLLVPFLEKMENEKQTVKYAYLVLQLSVNETRDDSVSHHTARAIADRATSLFKEAVESGLLSFEELSSAYLIIGSNILGTGWREAVPEAISRFKSALEILERTKKQSQEITLLLFRALVGLGFAHGLLGDHENLRFAIEYTTQAVSLLAQSENVNHDYRHEVSCCQNLLGWICLTSVSDEFWETGIVAFQRAIELRESLFKDGKISAIELASSRLGLALSLLRSPGDSESKFEKIRETFLEYIPLFPTDTRAYVEASIAIYDTVWLSQRHGKKIPERLLRLFDDVVRMLSETIEKEDKPFTAGAKLVLPFLLRTWELLQQRAQEINESVPPLSSAASLFSALAKAKTNLEALNTGLPLQIKSIPSDAVRQADPLLAQYWDGQTAVLRILQDFHAHRDFSKLSNGLRDAAVKLRATHEVKDENGESTDFIYATTYTFSNVLAHFVKVLESLYLQSPNKKPLLEYYSNNLIEQYSIMLPQEWLGLLKITEAYLQMLEQSENVHVQLYLNAVFSNISRALRMMDSVALIERRILASLGNAMSHRYYIRR